MDGEMDGEMDEGDEEGKDRKIRSINHIEGNDKTWQQDHVTSTLSNY